VNAALGRTVTQAMGRGPNRKTIAALADETGLGESWIKQVRKGSIDRPPREKLERLASALGLDLHRLLAMTDQLGAAAAHTERPATSDGAGLSALPGMLVAQAEAFTRLFEAAARLDETVEERLRTMEAALQSLREQLGVQGPGERSAPLGTME
jgi:transcriptional regulator with XRE-family HTH domain